jgi:IPT/TIG domain-containing protein
MRSCLVNPRKPFPWLRIAFVLVLPLVLCGGTCTTFFGFQSCLGIPPAPQLTSLSPNVISANTQSVLLVVAGNNFVSQSQIFWNGNALPTVFVDSQHLEVTITQQIFEQFGGSPGSNVLISVNSVVTSPVAGCPIGGSSVTLVLIIN